MRRIAALALVLLAGPSRAAELTVFAASSLREAFGALALKFEEQHPGVRVMLELAGSQELRVQIENGAPADVFASADEKQMARLGALALRPSPFAHNEPVLIVPRDNPAGLRELRDLPRARRVVLGAPEVPVGAYADRILAAARIDLGARVVSRELNVRQVLAKVALGEADAGIVYRTDTLASREVLAIAIPKEVSPLVEYPIAALAHAREPRLAEEFVGLVRSPAGAEILRRSGFAP